MASVETKSNQILRKQNLVNVLVTHVYSNEQKEDLWETCTILNHKINYVHR